MVIVRVFTFQPFSSRVGRDTVVGLRFKYDPRVIDLIKAALREAQARFGTRNAGGWLQEHKSWFAERYAWFVVRRRLAAAGVTLLEDLNADAAAETRSIPEWAALVRALQEDNAFMQLLVHDLKEESSAYGRGVVDGLEQARLAGVSR